MTYKKPFLDIATKNLLVVWTVLVSSFLSAIGMAALLFGGNDFLLFLAKLIIIVATGFIVGLFLIRFFAWRNGG